MPSTCDIELYMPAGCLGVRIYFAAYPGYTIPPYYDSMIARVISYGSTREEAVTRMKRALDEFIVEDIYTTIPFHRLIMVHDVFVKGDFNTNFLTDHPIMEKGQLKERAYELTIFIKCK